MRKLVSIVLSAIVICLIDNTVPNAQIDTSKVFPGHESPCLPIGIEKITAIPSGSPDGGLIAIVQPKLVGQIFKVEGNIKGKGHTANFYDPQKFSVGNDVFSDACIGQDGDFWTIANRVPVVISKNREMAYFDSFPPNTYFRSIMKGNGSNIIITTGGGIYITADRGLHWELMNGEFTHDLENIKHVIDSDTTWLRFLDSTPRKIVLDRGGIYWVEWHGGLIYSGDNLKSWQQFKNLPEISSEFGHGYISIAGITPSGQLIIITNDNSFWIMSRNKDGFKKMCAFKSHFAGESEERHGIFKAIFMNNTLAYIDACYKYRSHPDKIYERHDITCPDSPVCTKSLIVISRDYGKSWQKYALGDGITVDDMKIIDKYLYAYTTLGILQIPIRCFE